MKDFVLPNKVKFILNKLNNNGYEGYDPNEAYLPEEDISNNYEMFKYFIKTYIKREGVDKLIEWLDSSDASEAPCSTQYHLSCKGGLIQHSLNVFSRLIKCLKDEYGEECPYTQEQIAIVAILHDLSKNLKL